MTEALYPTRLYWTPMGGFARYEGREVKLNAPPELPGVGPVQSIDYAPGTVALVLPRFGDLRELEQAERHAALQLLVRLAGPGPGLSEPGTHATAARPLPPDPQPERAHP